MTQDPTRAAWEAPDDPEVEARRLVDAHLDTPARIDDWIIAARTKGE